MSHTLRSTTALRDRGVVPVANAGRCREKRSSVPSGTPTPGADFYCEVAIPDPSRLDVVHNDELVLAFHHTNPGWETHIVVVPKSTFDHSQPSGSRTSRSAGACWKSSSGLLVTSS